MIRILLAEDQAMIRGALVALLGREPDLAVIAQVDRGDAVLEAARSAQVDVAILDIELPGLTGLEAARVLRDAMPGVRILMLTVFDRPGYLRRAMDAGALGFLLKDSPPEQLAEAVRVVAAGRRVVDPKLALAALAEGSSPLTPRERDVLAAGVDGATVEQIAALLNLSRGTVRNHLSVAIQKLEARNRFDAARIAEEKGWL